LLRITVQQGENDGRTSAASRRHGTDGDANAKCDHRQGYSVGPAGANGTFNDDTLNALESFQGDNALPVQPLCDQKCWTALGLPGP
jgi:hypothetical protein